jgi:photosystem II stability/assembly factor-like uncharacterized protein
MKPIIIETYPPRTIPIWTLIVFASFFTIYSCSTENTPVYTLTTDVSPAEAGSVSPDQWEFDEGTEVQVNASANEHWVFTGWSGDYSGSNNPVTVMMDDDKSLSALFEKKEYALTVTIEGEGTVEERLVNAKSTEYPAESMVELRAIPAGGWEFTGWAESLSGTENPETVTINSSVSVTAMFEKVVNVTVEGEGDVQVEYIDGEAEKRETASRRVRLTATPQNGWKFVSWEGDLTGSDNPIETTFNEEMTVDAVFVSDQGRWVVEETFTNKNITSIFFINEDEGWITTIPDEIAHIGGSIYHTNDGGETWTEQLKGDPYKEFFYDVEFADADKGWAIMQSYHSEMLDQEVDWHWYGAVMHTTNGGQTWTEQHFIEGGLGYDLEVIDRNTAWVVGNYDYSSQRDHGIILETSDGGSSWTEVVLNDNSGNQYRPSYYEVEFAGSSIGWIPVGENFDNFKTTNGGNSWNTTSQFFYTMDFVDNMNGFGIKGEQIYRTTNQGDSWTLQSTVSGSIFASDFVNSELGWVVKKNGEILQTTDGAKTWQGQRVFNNGAEFNIPSEKIYNVHFPNSQSGWAGGEGGFLLRYVSTTPD